MSQIWKHTLDMDGNEMSKTQYNDRTIIIKKNENEYQENCLVIWRTPIGKFMAKLFISEEQQKEEQFLDYVIEVSDRQYSNFIKTRN